MDPDVTRLRRVDEGRRRRGPAGDIRWNFEKFLVGPDGSVTRFSPTVTPDDPALVSAIEASLPG
jgi:glutathione peroxidase-family protein